MEMCKSPRLATQVTLGPIEDFNFDAAILFSDLLFPLEHLNMGLHYNDGPPKLPYLLTMEETWKRLQPISAPEEFYDFQRQALVMLRQELPAHTDLLGFVGAPFTLYTYAMEGGHSGNLIDSKLGLYDGRFELFLEHLLPSLLSEMIIQAKGKPQAICLFDTAAGELCVNDYKNFVVPVIHKLLKDFKKACKDLSLGDIPIVYYSKMTHLAHLELVADPALIQVLGVDWRHDLTQVYDRFSRDFFIQGNIDPSWLFLPQDKLLKEVESYLQDLSAKAPNLREKGIFGLGHGVLPKTPEDNVRKVVQLIQNFSVE